MTVYRKYGSIFKGAGVKHFLHAGVDACSSNGAVEGGVDQIEMEALDGPNSDID